MALPRDKQLGGFQSLRQTCERCRLNRDSTYAQIVHRLGALFFFQKKYSDALTFTRKAIQVNAQKRPDASPSFLPKSLFNLGSIYLELQDNRHARGIFQQVVTLGSRFPERHEQVARAYWHLANLFFKESDYQKAIRQAELGVSFATKIGNTELIAANLTEKANSLKELGNNDQALAIVQQLIQLFGSKPEPTIRLANAYSTLASVLARLHRFSQAQTAYEKAYVIHSEIENPMGQAEVTSNMGFLYDNYLHQYDKALTYYRKALTLIGDDKYGRVRILSNIGEIYWRKRQFRPALHHFQVALDSLQVNERQKPAELTQILRQTPYKEYLLSILQNQADTWLDWGISDRHHKMNALRKALHSYRLADQLIDVMRFEQTGQQSKLYWRQQTHSLYERAIETAYLLNDSEIALHFFEKSRAVLLTDKLNELGARQQLPPQKVAQERTIRQAIASLQTTLAELKTGTRPYDSTRTALLTEQEKLDAFLRKTEEENPAYYRYKYDNRVPSLSDVQRWLENRRATLVSYFVGDSALYVFSIGPDKTQLLRHSVQDYQKTVREFLPLCASGEQNRQFGRYLQLSHQLYSQLIQPLQLSTEHIIVSPDYHFIPFEGLSRRADQPDFLIHQHAFSYGYSATVLLKEQSTSTSGGAEFLGMAPVNFNPKLQQATLLGSNQLVTKIGELFSRPTVLTHQTASRQAFQTLAPKHQVVQLFTHADADSVDREPLLYFADSTLRLSELNEEISYKTQLIVLSACKTGLGVNQEGEGIFSLARGFASLGIPSVLTTLWSVEDQATYALTERFYHHLSEGLPKDIALQKAKLDWLKTASQTNQLPFRWAGLILVGNTEPLSAFRTNWLYWASGLVIILAGILIWLRFRRKQNRTTSYSKTRT